jgi:hypothetical protein
LVVTLNDEQNIDAKVLSVKALNLAANRLEDKRDQFTRAMHHSQGRLEDKQRLVKALSAKQLCPSTNSLDTIAEEDYS